MSEKYWDEEIWIDEEQRYVPASSLKPAKCAGDLSYGMNAVPLFEVLESPRERYSALVAMHTGATPDVFGGPA